MKIFNSLLATAVLVLMNLAGFSQSFTSSQDGPWNDVNTWGGAGIPDAGNSSSILIQHAVNIPNGQTFSIDQTTIDAGGYLTIENGATITLANGTGDDLTVDANGFLQVDGILINSNLAFIANTDGNNVSFTDGSTFTWEYTTTEGTPPLASWEDGSTLNITGYTTLAALTSANWDQSFYNVTWNANSLANTFNFDGKITDIRGTLDIISVTGTARIIRLNATLNSTITIGSINVSGNSILNMNTSGITTVNVLTDLSISGTTALLQLNTTGTLTLNVGQDFNYGSSSVSGSGSYGNLSGTLDMFIERDFNITAGTGRFRGVQTGGTGSFTIGRNFALNSGTFGENGTNATVVMNFNNGTSHNFLNSGTMTGSCFVYNIGASDTLVVGTSPLVGSNGGTCVCQLNLDGTLEVGNTNASGSIQLNTASGNVRVPTGVTNRNYNSGSTIIYRSSSNLFMGNGHPTSSGVNTVIDISATGITMTGNRTITGDLTLLDGNLALNGNSLTLEGDLSFNAGSSFVTTAASDLIINGSGDFGTLPLSTASSIDIFTLNRPGGIVSPDQNLTITGVTNFTDGTLDFSGRTLNLNGAVTTTSGLLAANSSSTLSIGGTGAFSGISFDPSFNTVGTLTCGRTGTIPLGNTVTVANALNLTSGTLDISTGLILGNNATITRSAGSLATNRPTVNLGESYNVSYTGNVTTGLELPDPINSTDLNNLTIGATVTLNQNVTVNGTVNLNSGTLTCGSNIITMEGSAWNDNGGSFTPGTGTVIFNGTGTTIGGSSTPLFGNLTLNTGASLTLPAGLLDLSGNLQLTAGATLNANGGTINFNSAVTQQLAGGGLTLNNLTINKGSSADVTLTSPLNITGLLSIASDNTEFISNGNLTLISTSDATSGNASIGPLINTGAAITGDVNVQRYMSSESRIYRYLASPISNGTVASIQDDIHVTGNFTGSSSCTGCSTNASMFYYNGATSTYVAYPTNADGGTAAPLTPGRGYSVFVRQDLYPGAITIDFTGPVNQGAISLPVAHNGAAAESWNMVGNPYPSTIDWDLVAGWTKTNIFGTVAVRDNGSGGSFRYWDGATGALSNGFIAQGQGFWIRTTGAAPVLDINENAKVSSTGEFLRSKTRTPDALEITFSNGSVKDWTYFRVDNKAGNTYDQFDTPKLPNDILNMGSRSSDGKLLAINVMPALPCQAELPLDLSFAKKSNGSFVVSPVGTWQMEINPMGRMRGFQLELVDQYTATRHLVTPGIPVSIEITTDPASYDPNRFIVVLGEKPLSAAPLISASDICDETWAQLTIAEANPGEYYFIYSGDSLLEEVSGADFHEVTLNAAELTGRSIRVEAVAGCGNPQAIASLELQSGAKPVLNPIAANLCDAGPVQLQVTTSSEVQAYRWYESETDLDPVYESSSNEFVTPVLLKSKTYYVEALGTNGCPSSRVPVTAGIHYIEPLTIDWSANALTVISSNPLEGSIQWYWNGEVLPGATTASFSPENSGQYTVILDRAGCISQADYVLEITSLEEGRAQGISIFPNPFDQEISVRLPAGSAFQRVELISPTGATLKRSTIVPESGGDSGVLDAGKLSRGIYYLRLSGIDKSLIFKLVKD